MRLSLAAWGIAHVPESRASLLASAHGLDQDVYNIADFDIDAESGPFLDRCGRTLVTRSTLGSVVRRDVDSRRTLSSASLHDHIMDVSPDSKTLPVSAPDGARLWHADPTEQAAVPFAASVSAVGRFQADGRALVLSDSYDTPTVQVWNVDDRRLLFQETFKHPLSPAHTAVSDDATRLAICPQDGTLQMWDMATRRRLAPPSVPYRCPSDEAFQHLRFLQGGRSCATTRRRRHCTCRAPR
ncbi:WD40 repeat domain-containing protein [Streptomyces melanogenes]|uniref:WD40 repeat domain-containing protein n=1 Tax=Streptomyces melanogenes TaxID=67326 RepID=UPI00378CF1C7